MKFAKVVQNISTVLDLKRIASPYVIDYRGLDESEIKQALIKTSPQYSNKANVEKAVDGLFRKGERPMRIMGPVLLRGILLQRDDYMAPKKDTEDSILKWEQKIIDQSNEDILRQSNERRRDLEFFQYVLEAAWENNDEISPDEFHLLDKIRTRLKVTPAEYRTIEAKLGKFPLPGNNLHSRAEIEETRRSLQSNGLLFTIRDTDGTDFDIIPDEVAQTLKDVLGLEIRDYGYAQMLRHKAVRSKDYLKDVLEKVNIKTDRNPSLEDLYSIFIEQVSPRTLIGGVSSRDGLAIEELGKWCNELGLPVSGSKNDRIDRIIEFSMAFSGKRRSIQIRRNIPSKRYF